MKITKQLFHKAISFALVLCLAISLCACSLTGARTYQGNMELPSDGVISENEIQQICSDQAVVTYSAESAGMLYEWTIFGDDIEQSKQVNLALELSESADKNRVTIKFLTEEEYGFPLVLSIHLNTLWDAQSATLYDSAGNPVCGGSITGQKTSVVNLSITNCVGEFYLEPDIQQTPEQIEIVTDKEETQEETEIDPYLTSPEQSGGRVISDGKDTGQDEYHTDPIPEGKPRPVEPGEKPVDQSKTYTCTFSIECSTILNNLNNLNQDKLDAVPSDGVILPVCTVSFYEGESVFDVLQRVCQENGIHMESSWTPMYNSAYVEGIHNLYEFDCGNLSGWMYRVNGWYPNYGCSRYQLAQGDVVEWRYTCDLGKDIGGGEAVGG